MFYIREINKTSIDNTCSSSVFLCVITYCMRMVCEGGPTPTNAKHSKLYDVLLNSVMIVILERILVTIAIIKFKSENIIYSEPHRVFIL